MRQAVAALMFQAKKTIKRIPTSLKEKRKDILRQHISKFHFISYRKPPISLKKRKLLPSTVILQPKLIPLSIRPRGEIYLRDGLPAV